MNWVELSLNWAELNCYLLYLFWNELSWLQFNWTSRELKWNEPKWAELYFLNFFALNSAGEAKICQTYLQWRESRQNPLTNHVALI